MEKKKARMPKLELSPEATARLAQLSEMPHHPSAVGSNIAKAREVLRRRLTRRAPRERSA